MMIRPSIASIGKGVKIQERERSVDTGGWDQVDHSGAAEYSLSTVERTAVREALDRATQGGFADEVDVDATLRRSWG